MIKISFGLLPLSPFAHVRRLVNKIELPFYLMQQIVTSSVSPSGVE